MRSGTIAFLLGVLALQQFEALPDSSWMGLMVISLPFALLIKSPFNLAGWFVSGFLWSLLFAQQVLSIGLAPELEGKNLLIEGQVASLPVINQRRIRFELDVQHVLLDGEAMASPGKIRLSWYTKTPPRELVPGETWRFLVRLKRPAGLMNPGGFDYEAWLLQQHIRATGYIRKSAHNQRILKAQGYPIHRVRYWIKNRLQQVAGDDNSLGMLLALVIGDKSGITDQQWQSLQLTGTNHLMAISGLHIGLLAGIAFFLGQYLWRWTGTGMLYIAAPRVGALSAIATAVSYAALAGFAIPTQRALIMVVVTMLALFRAQPVNATRVLAAALLLVLLFDPLSVLSVSFWLSFAAVAIIFYCSSGRLVSLPKWRQGMHIQLWISLGMFPLVLFWFQQVSLSAPLVNFIVVPLVGLIVVPLALLATLFVVFWPSLGSIVIHIPLWLLSLFDWLISRMDHLTWLQWNSSGGILETALASIGLLVLLAPRGFPGKYLGWILILPILLGPKNTIPLQTAYFSLLDVGQGLSAVVQTRNHTLVFDTGAKLSPRFDMGKAVVVPFLRHQGVRRIDKIIVSHKDNDHRGGFRSILKYYPVKSVLTSVAELRPYTTVTKPCYQGDHWQWDGVLFEILHPGKENKFKGNNTSCILKITAGNKSVLLTGDIEKPAERWLAKTYKSQLNVDVLVAAHHGSNTSSIDGFIDAVSPQIVLFPVGYRNRYHFPAKLVVDRYSARGVDQFQTDSGGAISLVLGESTDLQPQQYRKISRRYWHRQ
jgi:competence protein ComEC